jgi:hypothetical protein
VDDDAVATSLDGVRLSAQARVTKERRAEGVGERVRPLVDELEVPEHVLVPVKEPLDEREVEATLEVEEWPEQRDSLVAHTALDEIAEQRVAVVVLDDAPPAPGLRHEIDERLHRAVG